MFWQQMVNAISLGAMYSLLAIGYTMVYGIIKLINFAHGEIFMCGAFVTWWFMTSLGLSFPVSALIGIMISTLVGIGVERIAYRPLRNAPRFTVIISVLGMSIFLQNLARIIWGAESQTFDVDFNLAPIIIGGVVIPIKKVFILSISFILMLALGIYVKRTNIGKAMRATAVDPEAAQMMGININGIIVLTFAIGSFLGSIAGILFAINYNSIDPFMGFNAGLKAFSAAVLGGIGNIYGAMIGGILLGVFEGLGAGYISSMYRDAFAFGLLILVLIFRPEGVFGEIGKSKESNKA